MNHFIFNKVKFLVSHCPDRDPFQLAKALNIYVSYKDLGSLKGFYCQINHEKHIVINQDLPDWEISMILAHEIGHDQLHSSLIQNGTLPDFCLFDPQRKAEHEANLFAADFLISDEAVTQTSETVSYFELARELYVPADFLLFKIECLKKRGTWIPLYDNHSPNIDMVSTLDS